MKTNTYPKAKFPYMNRFGTFSLLEDHVAEAMDIKAGGEDAEFPIH